MWAEGVQDLGKEGVEFAGGARVYVDAQRKKERKSTDGPVSTFDTPTDSR